MVGVLEQDTMLIIQDLHIFIIDII